VKLFVMPTLLLNSGMRHVGLNTAFTRGTSGLQTGVFYLLALQLRLPHDVFALSTSGSWIYGTISQHVALEVWMSQPVARTEPYASRPACHIVYALTEFFRHGR
jgi:hypothetical protein